MAVVVNDFEASVEAGGEGKPAGGKSEMKARDFRRHLRDVATRALRVRPR